MDLASSRNTGPAQAQTRTGALDAPIVDPRELSFDQYARHRLVAELLERCLDGREDKVVLDVGGRTGLLGKFLGGVRITAVDFEAGPAAGMVLGDGSRLPFRDATFDAVTSCDTLEHVPTARREAFVRECCRVSRGLVVLAGPFCGPRVDEAERALAELVRATTGSPHRYLEEHRQLGLPERAQVEGWLRDEGLDVHAVGHGNLERWLALLSLSLYMDSDPHLRGVARRYYRFFNETLFEYDYEPPYYRHALVAFAPRSIDAGRLALLGARSMPPEAIAAFDRVLNELLAFDRERDVYEAERARLAEVNEGLVADLDGHRSVIEELRGHQKRLELDLDSVYRLAAEQNEKLVAYQSELERLRCELRSRKQNFMRAVSWKRPEP